MARIGLLALLAVLCHATEVADSDETANMLIGLVKEKLANTTTTKKAMEVENEERTTNCDMDIARFKGQVEEATTEIEVQFAKEQEFKAKNVEFLGLAREGRKQVAGLQTELSQLKQQRSDEHDDFLKLEKDLSQSVSALKRAIGVLTSQPGNFLQQLQVLHRSMPTIDGKVAIESLLSQPERAAYDNQSGGIIAVLKKLLTQFEDELFAAQKSEANDKNNDNLMGQELQNRIEQGNEKATADEAQAENAASNAAKAKERHDNTVEHRDQTQKMMRQTQSKCLNEKRRYEKAHAKATREIHQLEIAIGELSSADKTANALMQLKKKASFLQVGTMNPKVARIVELLDARAVQLHSKTLSALAVRVTADPFKKIKEMIEDLVMRLKQEAAKEAEQHGWCVAEMESNHQTRTSRRTEVESLMAQIAENEANIASMQNDIEERQKQSKDLDEQKAKETKFRNKDHAMNTDIIEKTTAALANMEKAKGVFDKLEATEPAGESPYETIKTLISNLQKQFADSKASAENAEKSQQSDFDASMDQIAIGQAELKAEIAGLQESMKRENQDMNENKVEKKSTKVELDAAQAKFEELKPVCAPPPVDLAERERQRQAEIQSLKEVLSILEEK